MAEIRDTRRKLQIAIAAMVGIDVLALALLVSPLVGSSRAREEQQEQLWRELQAKTREVEPLQNVDNKIVTAREQIADFYKTRLPGTNSAISEELGKLAGETGVKIGQVRYKLKDPEPVGLHPIEIQADFRRRLLASGPIHQRAGTRSAVLYHRQRATRGRAGRRSETADEAGNVLEDRRVNAAGHREPEQDDSRGSAAGTGVHSGGAVDFQFAGSPTHASTVASVEPGTRTGCARASERPRQEGAGSSTFARSNASLRLAQSH